MKLPTLYSRTSTGAVQEWTIEVLNDSYRTISGQVNGQHITSEWTVCEAKNVGRANETTAQEQAMSEAQAKWKKKLDKDYKENVDDIDEETFFSPMLAKNYDDRKDTIKFPIYSQPKLDGIRCIISSKGAFTRNGKEILTVGHIQKLLAPFLDKYPNMIFDGELYNHKFKDNFNKIASLVKKIKPTQEELDEAAKFIQYWCYDCSFRDDMRFAARHNFLVENIRKNKNIPSHIIKIVFTNDCANQKQLDTLYETYVSDNFEGQIIRFDEQYENKRSAYLLKRKEFKDEEFEILDILEGDGNKSGMAGAMVFKTKEGRQFNSNIKGTWEECAEYLKNKRKYIGKLATIKFFNWTPDKVPRFPYVIGIRDYE